jgi:hypothetical protein
VSAIHGSTNIIADHDDIRFELYVGDFTVTTTFSKLFVTSNNKMEDMNHIEDTVLLMANAGGPPYNVEIHITT